MRHACRRDDNHAEIVSELRKAGYDVMDLGSVGGGIPDLSVKVSDFVSVLLEVKDGNKPPSKQRLTAAEQAWMIHWGHITRIVNSPESALEAVREFQK